MTKRIVKPSESTDSELNEVRLDVWLWATRFFKTRAVAKQAIESGKVRIDEKAVRPATSVRVANRMTVVRGDEHFEIEVTGLTARRGSPTIARANYQESAASMAARQAASEQRRMLRDGYQKPPSKPDKRARRLIKALGDIDMT